jgi:hypothetical protein
VTFARLRPADWVVLAAALVLVLVTAVDWYSTQVGTPLALALLGAIAFAAAVSVREQEGAMDADLQSRR